MLDVALVAVAGAILMCLSSAPTAATLEGWERSASQARRGTDRDPIGR